MVNKQNREKKANISSVVKRQETKDLASYDDKKDLYSGGTKKEMKKMIRKYKSLEFMTNMYVMDFREKVRTIVNLVKNPSEVDLIDADEITGRQTERLEALVEELDEFSGRMEQSKDILEDYAFKLVDEIHEYDKKFTESLYLRAKYAEEVGKNREKIKNKRKSSEEYADAFKSYLKAYRSYYDATNDCLINSKKRLLREKEMDEIGEYWRASYSVDHLMKLQQADVEKLAEHLENINPVLTEIGRNVKKNYSVQKELEKTSRQLKKHREFLDGVNSVVKNSGFYKATVENPALYQDD